jgi:hypothetical protein
MLNQVWSDHQEFKGAKLCGAGDQPNNHVVMSRIPFLKFHLEAAYGDYYFMFPGTERVGLSVHIQEIPL